MKMLLKVKIFLVWIVFIYPLILLAFPQQAEIQQIQNNLVGKSIGERIAFWAEKFVGTPYDEDPQGTYVTRKAIVADDRVDCMYLVFRSVELALSSSPEQAIQIALEKRFHTHGIISNGQVINYEDRLAYGEDLIFSGKWGQEVTRQIGQTVFIKGLRGKDLWAILPPDKLLAGSKNLRTGDLIFFVKYPEQRLKDEGVGHMGIVKIEGKNDQAKIFLIHASGLKNKGGAVKKVPLAEYLAHMPFRGVMVTRFE